MSKVKSIQTQVTINSPIQTVWSVLTDFDKYPAWNPFLVKVEKISSQKLKITTCIEGKKNRFTPKIICLKPLHELRWLGKFLGISWLFKGEHYFLLKPLSTNKTSVIHGENFSGFLANISWSYLEKRLHESFSRMNNALKETAEKNALYSALKSKADRSEAL